jgi:glutamate carboxypeptidase
MSRVERHPEGNTQEGHMAALTDPERKVLDWIAGERATTLGLIEALVNTDSGSFDKAGVDAVGARIRTFVQDRGIGCDVIPNERYGDAVRATVGDGGGRTILLMGHRDTVYGRGEAAQRPFRVAAGRGSGPGCCDMKAGLAMNAIVLAAFKTFGAPAPLVGLFTADEEIGSPSSRALIEAEARRARAVFNAEPGRPNGGIVTGRKGGVFMKIEVTGKAAHAGNNLADGVSAIEEIARKIIALHALTDLARGISCNVGTVAGGQAVNMVAPSATAGLDLRFIKPADRAGAMTAIEHIVAHRHMAGASARLEITGEFAPLVASDDSKQLYAHYADCARTLGQAVREEFAGGCADSGFAASVGAPTLCGVGPIGGRAHSPDEYLDVDSIVPRAQALALAVMRLG